MSPQSGSKKRQAPGSIPIPPPQILTATATPLPPPPTQPIVDAAVLQLPQTPGQDIAFSNQDYNDLLASLVTNGSSTEVDPVAANPDYSVGETQSLVLSTQADSSNQLVRREPGTQLVERPLDLGSMSWSYNDPQSNQIWDVTNNPQEFHNLEADQSRERDSPTKKRQIPPFVLKLWKFLDGEDYSSLIRWTDNGTAFIVCNEDEFARTVIPEYWKHNNFASFVRQLNMYGFSKRPSIHAHSMKAAERKVKEPPVWSHKYFQKGREDLLYLIQKPPNKNANGKRRRGATNEPGDSDDDQTNRATFGNATTNRTIKNDPQDLITLPRSEIKSLREEVQRLQQQQGMISRMIAQLTQKNEQFYQQASNFQSLHERHENSINAILTFLATFYNRSLEAGMNLNDMFGNSAQREQQQGTVVDVGDTDFGDGDGGNTKGVANNQVQRYRAPQLLLENHPVPAAGLTSAVSPSPRISKSAPSNERGHSHAKPTATTPRPQSATSQNGRAATSDSTHALDSPEMLSLINAVNANSPSDGFNIDFSSVLDHAQHANGKQPLTPGQRRDMLNLIASQGQQPKSASQPGANNALMNPNPPPMPDLEQYMESQEQLDQLAQLQREQDAKVQQLAGRLSPLSPTGSIPGLKNSYGFSGATPPLNLDNNLGGTSGDFDMDAFINDDGSDGYFGNLINDDGVTDPENGTTTTTTTKRTTNDEDLFGDTTNDAYDRNDPDAEREEEEEEEEEGADDDDDEDEGSHDVVRGRVHSLASSGSVKPSPVVSDDDSARVRVEQNSAAAPSSVLMAESVSEGAPRA